MPVGQWLRNGVSEVPGPNLQLLPNLEGINQCVGVVLGQPETDFTGESASDFYLLVQGIIENQSMDLELTSVFLFQLSTPPPLTSLQTWQYLSWVRMR